MVNQTEVGKLKNIDSSATQMCCDRVAEMPSRREFLYRIHARLPSRSPDRRVGPLYEHTFPPSLAPSLSFIGIPRKAQAKWVAQLLSGKRTLPSYVDMMVSVKEYHQSRDAAGIPKHNTHDIANFEYCDRYCDQAGFPRLEEWRKDLCVSALQSASTDLETYRDCHDDDDIMLQTALQSSHFTQSEEPNY